MSSASGFNRAVQAVAGFFALRPAAATIAPNLVSAAISTVTVVCACLLFGPQLGMVSLLGALTTFWETGRPLWARIRNGLLVSAALTASMSAGVLVAPYQWAIVPASVLIILLVSLAYYAFTLTAGPSPVMMFYAAVLGTFFGADQRVGWQAVGITASAAIFTSVLLLVPLVFVPHAPERRAVVQARSAVAAYEKRPGADPETQRISRNNAYQAVSSAWLTLRSAWPADRGPRHRELAAELMQINRSLAATILGRLGVDSAIRPLTPDTPLLLGRPSRRFLISRALRGHSVECFTSWRMALAAGIAGTISQLIGIGHPYWAILTATVVINQWMDRGAATRRAAHRTVGTLLGIGVVWAVSALNPSVWWSVVIVLLCMVGQYLVLPMNYAFALMFITPMALLAVEASGTGGTMASLSFDRFSDTLIGAMTAVAVTWGTSWFFPRRLVRAQSPRTAAALAAVEDVNRTGDQFSPEGRRARVELQYELIHHLSVLERAVRDDPRLADLADAEHRLADAGYAALGRAWQVRPVCVAESA
ncbi:FUSC family protein [Streptomyces sp. NEAU-YJ-81]|uniref:FUSC family protein n=1 Tax=Streptomyces sp. NEAU-YJ-81 TaxID=2820288 RepID=UPI001ABD093C|nr:FUSC family protein [Streptomyces sp. NEAU-YJ-81]MBO3680424.1 FUSC family protein [Streptomyces sp. NEAU-YJ-81]